MPIQTPQTITEPTSAADATAIVESVAAEIEVAARARFDPLAERHQTLDAATLETLWSTWLAAFAAGARWYSERRP